MTVRTADFERGTVGNTITNTDAGNQDTWNSVFIDTGNTLTYDSFCLSGSKSAKMVHTSTNSYATTCWEGLSDITSYFRIYCYFTSYPASSDFHVIRDTDAPVNNEWSGMSARTNQKVDIGDRGSIHITQSSNSYPLNRWFRLELGCFHNSTTGWVEGRMYFDDPHAVIATETLRITSADTSIGGVGTERAFYGSSAPNNGLTWYMDALAYSSTDWLGPAVPSYLLSSRQRTGLAGVA